MSNGNDSRILNPNAREAMDKFKMEAAGEVGVNLKKGYNGELTSRQAGSVGGQMVKKSETVRIVRTCVFERESRILEGHRKTVKYIAAIEL